jgi:hypothetical protein
MKHPFPAVIICCLFGFCSLTPVMAQVNVLTYHNDNVRTGANTNETLLTPANVNSNTFGQLFRYNVDGYVYAQPLYVSAMNIPGQGTHNVLFIATEHNSVYAFDADSTNAPSGGLLWQTNLGISAVTPNLDFGTRYNGGQFTDITNEVGITGSPVIDLASGTLYVNAFTHEGGNYFHRIHALNITNGTERSFSPVLVSASFPGMGVGNDGLGHVVFNPKQQNQRCALTLAGGKLYVAYAGYADTDPYHGWIIGYDAATLQQLTNYVFNSTPNATTNAWGPFAGEAGIWMSGGGLAVDASTNLYFETGNGVFNATNGTGGTEYGTSFVKLSTTNGLAVADYFTPWNQVTIGEGAADTDLGSSGCVLLPDQPGPFPHLMVGGGKEGKVYLINRDQFTTTNNHYNATGTNDFVVQTLPVSKAGRLTSTPAYFNGWVYCGGWPNGGSQTITAFSLTNGLLTTNPISKGTRTYGFPGSTPAISANGTSNGIVWALKMGTTGNPGILLAHNATNLTNEIYNSTQVTNRDGLTNGVKFTVPIIANGKVYAGSQFSVYAFGLLGGNLAFSTNSYSAIESGVTATITVNRTGGTNGTAQVSYSTVAGGTATSGVDYVATSGTLSWSSGDSAPKTFNVTILNDTNAEPNETVNLVLSNSVGAYIGSQSTAVLTIQEESYEAWKFAHFAANANNDAIAGDLADPDGDGIANLLEYAMASDPNVGGTEGTTSGVIVANHFQLHLRRNTSASDLTYIVQAGNTLGTWADLMTYTAGTGWVANTLGATASESSVVGAPPDAYVNVTVTDPTVVGTPGAGSRYFHFVVHR